MKQKLNRLIKEYTRYAIADSWKGGGHPEEIPDIEADLKKSKEKLDACIEQLFEKWPTKTRDKHMTKIQEPL